MFSQLMDFNLNRNIIRKCFKEGLDRKLVDISENPERFIRAYLVSSKGGTLVTSERPALVSSYEYPIYFMDIPKNFRHIPLQNLFTFSRIGYIYDVKSFVERPQVMEILGYIQDEESNEQSGFIVGLVCGLIMQAEYDDN